MILIFAIQLRQNSTFYTKPDFLNPPSSNDRYLPALLGILRAELVSIQSGTGAAPERGFFFLSACFCQLGAREVTAVDPFQSGFLPAVFSK